MKDIRNTFTFLINTCIFSFFVTAGHTTTVKANKLPLYEDLSHSGAISYQNKY